QALQLPPSTSTGQGTQSVSVLTDLQLQQLSSIINRSPILQTLQQQPSQSLSTSEMGQLHTIVNRYPLLQVAAGAQANFARQMPSLTETQVNQLANALNRSLAVPSIGTTEGQQVSLSMTQTEAAQLRTVLQNELLSLLPRQTAELLQSFVQQLATFEDRAALLPSQDEGSTTRERVIQLNDTIFRNMVQTLAREDT